MQVMRKYLFYLLLAIATCIITGCSDNYAEEPNQPKTMTHEVSQSEALQHLNKILPDLKIPSTRGAAERSLPPITSSYSVGSHSSTRSDGEVEPYFHIFNFGNNEGFAIMSGDDRVTPLLALTFKGELTPDTEIDNPGFKIAYEMMEDYYVEQVSTSSLGGGNGSLPIDPGDNPELELYCEYSNPVKVFYDMPFGRCQVEWGQEDPYNKYCGLYEFGFESYVGCVPVAVAQLMSIYKYPSSYNGYTFNWNLMNQYVDNISYDEEDYPVATDQIARLMQQLGLPENLDVQYEVVAPGNGSSAFPEDIPHTLRNFGYTNGGVVISYNTEDIADELKAGYPVLINGFRDNGKGHQWLGHDIVEFFQTVYVYNGLNILVSTINVDVKYILCNWGWNGSYNGFYASNVFDTNSGPVDIDALPTRSTTTRPYYRHNLKMVTGIRK